MIRKTTKPNKENIKKLKQCIKDAKEHGVTAACRLNNVHYAQYRRWAASHFDELNKQEQNFLQTELPKGRRPSKKDAVSVPKRTTRVDKRPAEVESVSPKRKVAKVKVSVKKEACDGVCYCTHCGCALNDAQKS